MKKQVPAWVWAAAVLVAVLVFNFFFTPRFFDLSLQDGRLHGSLVDILNRAAPVGLLAMGMTFVIATGGVDLSVGAVMAIAGTVAAGFIARPSDTLFAGGQPLAAAAIPMALVAALACGMFNGLLVAYLELQPIVATLLLMVAGRGVAQLLANGQIVTFQEPGFAVIARGSQLGLPNPVWIFFAAVGLVSLLTRRTSLGLFIEASGSNPSAARYVGIDARAVKLMVYAISGLCAGMGGLILTADIQGADANNVGLYLELDAILAVSVGGTAMAGGRYSIIGSFFGALLMQALTTTILTRGVSPEVTLVLKAAVVVAVCALQSPALMQKMRSRTRRAAA